MPNEKNTSHDKQQPNIIKADGVQLTSENYWGKVMKIQQLHSLLWLLIPLSQTHIQEKKMNSAD